mgnify:CR=1 FL=1
MGRVNGPNPDERVRREPDFLVCKEGHWGILEVDGEAFHQTAAQDHSRDALFLRHGIRCVRHYSATTCFEEAPDVIADFLRIMDKVYQ